MITLEVAKRDSKEGLIKLRGEGKLPAVFYGAKEKASSISIKTVDFKKAWKDAGESTIVNLKTPAGELNALIHDVQFDAVTDEPIHADFYIVQADKAIEVEVPLEFVGVPPAVKDLGGVLVKVLHTLEIKALPKDLPHKLTVDISSLALIDSHITAEQVSLPSGVTLKTKPSEVVVLIAPEAKEEEELPPAPIDMSAIEVEKRGKEEEAPTEGSEEKSAE